MYFLLENFEICLLSVKETLVNIVCNRSFLFCLFLRKSVSSVESVFGVTEKQRLAKEEEERNVALVEIQLRDEHSFPALGVSSDTLLIWYLYLLS